ncbi:hypothetical protein SAMN04489806_1283 [Paramicrobacterium humi]|uniref:Uncharacterized protein n=1 Tax=Paramicrobacterium humi TaxID=640635 RepID=A0A1H4KRN8_9MICO|nr:hypothetical protein [Microbacterium humi]SEB61210.1 hypothetical protein SAMN04489806_1283 [Microbacterium humi]
MNGKHAGDVDPQDAERDESTATEDGNLGSLSDVGHTFDQTNGLVDGLEGNADDPDKVDERLDEPTDDGNS